jgi:HEAT repeat protein
LPGQAVLCPACAARVSPAPQGEVQAPPQVSPPWAAGDRIVLPFDPLAREAGEPEEGGLQRAVWWLAGTVVFLVALIGAVLLARSLRPLVGRYPVIHPAVLTAWTRGLQTGTEAQRQETAGKIVAAGPHAVAAILDRITVEDAATGKPLIISGAVRALAAADGNTVASLIQALRWPNADVRIGAASVLQEMGATAAGALDGLVAALGDENRWVRWIALAAIGNLGAKAKTAVPAVAAILSAPDAFTRRRAIEALGRIGPAAEKAAPALEKASQQDPDVSVQQAALVAIRQVRLPEIAREKMLEADPEVRELCRVLLLGDDEVAAAAAATTLGGMGLRAKDGVPALAMALRHNDKLRREAAAKALGKLGPFGGEFLPTLQAAAKDADPDVRAAAEKTVAEIEGKPPSP